MKSQFDFNKDLYIKNLDTDEQLLCNDTGKCKLNAYIKKQIEHTYITFVHPINVHPKSVQ